MARRLNEGEVITLTFHFRNDVEAVHVLGVADSNLRIIQDNTSARVVARGSSVRITGPRIEVARVQELLGYLVKRAQTDEELTEDDVEQWFQKHPAREQEADADTGAASEESPEGLPSLDRVHDDLVLDSGLIKIRPRTEGQAQYVRAMQENAITFCLGPAGTGKTYLAVAMAVGYLSRNKVQRIILTRPALFRRKSIRTSALFTMPFTRCWESKSAEG